MRKITGILLTLLLLLNICLCPVITAAAENDTPAKSDLNITAKGALLMEASTGTVIFEQNSHEQLRPASVTKIMTLILIFEALEKKSIKLNDTVTVSEYAAGMGGSQVFLEPNETQTVETLIKCISIASANDACVVMAEFIDGSEKEFVKHMNKKAKSLGMKDTKFVNCCGLDADGHVTSAYDIALMSRELTVKYPQIHKYSTIWMENITHTTKKGTSEFGLANTNKLIKQYPYATGLKTGSTSLAKYSVSATAVKDGVELIAVILAAPDYKIRFTEAKSLLNYGFSKCKVFRDEKPPKLPDLSVRGGTETAVPLSYHSQFTYVDVKGMDFSKIEVKLNLPESVTAPLKKGDTMGTLHYSLDGKEIGTVPVLCEKSVDKSTFKHCLIRILSMFCV